MMEPYYEVENGQLYHDKCEEVLSDMPANSMDTIITDPPYGLGFMGKRWDYDVPSIKIWQECLRVLKPGGTALIFAGSRTQHRMACNVEDAGFILKDCIMYLYGSGFPKAMDISKQLDKGHEREVIGYQKYTNQDIRGNAYDSERAKERPRLKTKITIPKTPESQLWNGWKSHGLKPAYEPILVCMKPNEGSYAQNALKWGVSGLNVDGCRIPIDPKADKSQLRTMTRSRKTENDGWGMNQKTGDAPQVVSPQGRFPANVILDDFTGLILDEQSGTSKSNIRVSEDTDKKQNIWSLKRKGITPRGWDDQGGASRYFKKCQPDSEQSRFIYLPKPSTAERNAGCQNLELKRHADRNKTDGVGDNPRNRTNVAKQNFHPTVKSLALMKYLCTLTKTPTKGTVLDPFAGSGSTLVACEQLGRPWIGIERESEYCEIAKARIKQETSQLKLFR